MSETCPPNGSDYYRLQMDASERRERLTPRERAEARFDREPSWDNYYDLIIEYEWPGGQDDHYEWVANAHTQDVLTWAEGIRSDEEQAESEE